MTEKRTCGITEIILALSKILNLTPFFFSKVPAHCSRLLLGAKEIITGLVLPAVCLENRSRDLLPVKSSTLFKETIYFYLGQSVTIKMVPLGM